jgi:hypothetical protein
VRVLLRQDALRATILPPSVRTFGKVDRRVGVRDEDDVRIYDLGRVKPQERIELQLAFHDQQRTAPRDWQAMLVSVQAEGEVRQGSAAAVTLGRYFYTIFGTGCW